MTFQNKIEQNRRQKVTRYIIWNINVILNASLSYHKWYKVVCALVSPLNTEYKKPHTLKGHQGILDLFKTSPHPTLTHSMTAYIRRSIITSPGCQNDPLVEMGASSTVMSLTYGFLQVALLCRCSRGHCGTVGAYIVRPIEQCQILLKAGNHRGVTLRINFKIPSTLTGLVLCNEVCPFDWAPLKIMCR